jgi:predicted SAM-dependent methyltransferase
MVAEPIPELTKLDIACGQNKEAGWTGIDLSGDADIVHDLFSFPWPIASGSVSEVRCSHFVEHIPHYRPEWGTTDGWWLFWDEVHRICAPDATIEVTHPYAQSSRAFWDPTHVRFIHEMTWQYLDRTWREAQHLDHYPTTSDFEVTVIAGAPSEDIATRSVETQMFSRLHYWNAVMDLKVTLRARK